MLFDNTDVYMLPIMWYRADVLVTFTTVLFHIVTASTCVSHVSANHL